MSIEKIFTRIMLGLAFVFFIITLVHYHDKVGHVLTSFFFLACFITAELYFSRVEGSPAAKLSPFANKLIIGIVVVIVLSTSVGILLLMRFPILGRF